MATKKQNLFTNTINITEHLNQPKSSYMCVWLHLSDQEMFIF